MDHEFQLSVTKALHPSEAPLKTKHARSVIIATHRHRGAKLFWNIITRQPLMEHRFTAWKFCHVLHKVLREGHDSCVRHSQVHKTLILEVGKLWGHLQDGVGKCIESYTQLLVNKLDFHAKNAGIPGCITMEFDDLRRVMGDDYNNYFQLCVEIFDYLDCIIALQAVIFTAITTYRMSSMTPQGQCRLAPVVTLISDSNPLYDLCVRVLFLLHDGISHDILAGHRARFNDLFTKLKFFYETVRPLQYFADIIQLPQLPDNAPNFPSVHAVGNYIAPVMHVYQEEPEEEVEVPVVEESLLDLSNASENNASTNGGAVEEEVVDASQIMIANLHEELRLRQMHIEQLVNVTREMSNLKVRNEALESEVHVMKEMLKNTTEIKDNLELKLREMEELQGEVKEGDEKYKKEVEKLDKFKTMYAKLREEHINLLRARNDDSKLLMAERKKGEDFQTEANNLKAQLEDNSRKTEEQMLTLSTKIKEHEEEAAKKERRLEELECELLKSKALFEKHDIDKSAVISEYENQLLEHKMELKKLKENYDLEVKTKQHEMNELLQIKASNETNIKDVQTQLEMTNNEKAKLSQKLAEIEEEYLLQSQTRDQQIQEKNAEVQALMQAKADNETIINRLQQQLESSNQTKVEQMEMANNEKANLKQKLVEAENEYVLQIQSREKEIQERQTEVENLKQAKAENESTINILQAQLEMTNNEKAKLSEKLSEVEEEYLLQTQIRDKQIQEQNAQVQALMQAKADNETTINKLQQQLESSNQTNVEQMELAYNEKSSLKQKLVEAENEYVLQIQNREKEIQERQTEVQTLKQAKAENESTINGLQMQLETCTKTNEDLQRNVNELNQNLCQIESQLTEANQKVVATETRELQAKFLFEDLVLSLNKLLAQNMDNNFTFDYFELMTIPDVSEDNVKQIQNHLQAIQREYKNGNVSAFMGSFMELTHALKIFHEHIMLIFSNTTDLVKAEQLRGLCNDLRQSVVQFYQMMEAKQDANSLTEISRNKITPKLNEIQTLIRSLQNSFSESLNVADMLQQELRDMDNIIEDATKQIMDLLLNTKSKHDGIQLEVNEKILDSCTNLMKCIVSLIQRSRELQNEIVSQEKGTFTVKEFYKRNNQWTEGLISASKNIAKGAKFLVDAANKTIVSDSADCFELIVAAQDIAASTAQLVIASKVKAKNESQKLANLTKASRDVSVATGQVVATVRDGNSKLEYKNEIDVSKLTPSQRKTMEMEMQIKVLQLEQSLQSEQQKLMAFRKAFYQSAED
ncbi:huntington interacting protein related 1 [Stomoxys calcitrans]|uniref:huntington interacting protein related 1 n=1 Tax=Stomoxys calcitrans TaxID=35570 RepID=UPI0027E3960C|nr:huntington interacting protein related 1 [Stomoxys calcitrans]